MRRLTYHIEVEKLLDLMFYFIDFIFWIFGIPISALHFVVLFSVKQRNLDC